MPKHPWSVVPAARSSAPILQLKLLLVLGALGLAALLGPLSFLLSLTRGGDGPAVAATSSDTRGFAELAARDFLAGRPTTLAVATGIEATFGVPNDGSDAPRPQIAYLSLAHTSARSYIANGRSFELHRFTAVTGAAEPPLTVDVTVLLTPEGPVLGAYPALGRSSAVTEKVPALDYQEDENKTSNLPAPVKEAVVRWAAAYAGGDSAALRVLADDPQEGTYDVLGGFTAEAPEVATAVVEGDDGYILRIRVLLRAAGAQGFQVKNDYDLLVTQASTANPKVVAYGPAGTAAAPLQPYSNNSNRRPSASNP